MTEYKVTITKGNDTQSIVVREYWQALTTALKAQNYGYKTKIEEVIK